jgi:imidazolonepropionase-like amidohydrolase
MIEERDKKSVVRAEGGPMRKIPRIRFFASVLVLVLGSCTSSDVEVATTAATTGPTTVTESTITTALEPLCEPGSFDETTELDGLAVVAFVDANVIAMTDDSVQEHMTVIVEDVSIAEVGPAAGMIVPEGALEVCASGYYLMPGLSDMHVHFDALEDRLLYVVNGVTTIRNMWGGMWHLSIRERFESKELLGPRLFTTGPITDGPSPDWPGSVVVSTEQEAIDEVARQAEAGFEAIKVYDGLSAEAYRGIVAEAAARGLSVVGHVPDRVTLEEAIDAGQKSIEHIDGFEPVLNQEELAAESGVWICPTLLMMKTSEQLREIQANEPEELIYLHPSYVELWRGKVGHHFRFEAFSELHRRLHEAGVNLMIGTDANNPYVIPGFSIHEELAMAVEHGMTAYEALRAATVAPAEFLEISAESGTVEEGKRADLVVLGSNPLEEISRTKDIRGVMVNGRWYQQARLQAFLEELIGRGLFSPEFSLDDAQLEVLYLRCETGDFLACDLLFWALEFATEPASSAEYERYGESCGDRNDLPNFQPCIYLHGGGPNLDQLRDDCLDGDLVACDGLYLLISFEMEHGPEYLRVAATCGGRIPEPPPELAGGCTWQVEPGD